MKQSVDRANRQLPRLLMVSGSYPDIPCGVSPHTECLCRLLAARGEYDVHLLTSDDPRVKPQVAQGYRVHPEVSNWGLSHVRSICRRIIAFRPEVVHLQNLTLKYRKFRSITMSVLAPMLKKMAPGIRLVVTQHDVAVGMPLLRRRYRPLFRWADAVLVSNSRDEQAIHAQGIDASKIYRAPLSTYVKLHGPDDDIRRVVRETMHLGDESTCVTYFGYVDPKRNIDVLLRALHLLHKRGRDIHGLIMGGPHPERASQRYYQHCQRLAEKLGIADHLTWTGFADDEQVADGLAASDVFVSLVQRGADMRNSTIITGMLARLPVITCLNPRYYVDPDLEQLGCVTIAPRDPDALAEAIVQIRQAPADADFLARRAAWLDPGAIWERHINVILRAYHGDPPPPVLKFEK